MTERRSFRERLGNWIAGSATRASTDAVEFEAQLSQIFGPGVGNQPAGSDLLRENRGIFDAGTRAIANRLASLDPQAKVSRTSEDGTLVDEVIDDHPLQQLMNRPHPNLSWRKVMRLTAQWIITVGDAYWLKVGNGFGVPAELHPVPAGRAWPVVRRGVVEHYVIEDGNGQQFPVDADVVVRFFLPDPENMWGGEGYLGPMGIQADITKFAGEHLRSHYQHDATPKTFLEAAEGATEFNKDSLANFFELWKRYYQQRTGERRGLPGIGPAGYKLIQVLQQSGADVTPLLEFMRDDQLMGLGTPRSVLGQVVSGDRSSAETNDWVFDKHAVKPLADMIEDDINLQLSPDFGGAVFMGFAPFVSEDKEYELRREAQDLEHGVRTINRVLEDRNDDTVPWGDDPVMLGKLAKYDPAADPQLPMVPGDDPDDDDDDEEATERALHIAVRKLARRGRRAA